MSEESKALVRRWLAEVFTQGNVRQVDEFFAHNYILHDPNLPEAVHGHEGIRWYVTMYSAAFPDARFIIEDQIAEGDKVVTRWTGQGTNWGGFLSIPPTGNRATVSGIEVDRIAGGKIDEAWVSYHPFAGGTPDPERFKQAFARLHSAFPDLRMAEAGSITEGNKVAFRWMITGPHEGEFMGLAPTGKRATVMGIDIFHLPKG
jgi:predicted ester cyclase